MKRTIMTVFFFTAMALSAQNQRVKLDLTAANTEEFRRAIAAVNADTRDLDCTITLGGSFNSNLVIFTPNAAKTITLKGDGQVRTITSSFDLNPEDFEDFDDDEEAMFNAIKNIVADIHNADIDHYNIGFFTVPRLYT